MMFTANSRSESPGRRDRGDPAQSVASGFGRREPAMIDSEPFLEHRPLLFSIAYRMLGTVVDAEDAVQETYLRWRRTTENCEEIRSPKAWLTTTISRVCLDQLGSARVKREQYIGPWLPEPLAGASPDIADTVADFDSLSVAFLVLLESLSAERAGRLPPARRVRLRLCVGRRDRRRKRGLLSPTRETRPGTDG